MDSNELIVAGYKFPSYKEAQIAIKEVNNIELIKKKTDFTNGEDVYQLYVKLISKSFFKTMVGYEFLSYLRNLLINEFYYTEYDLPNIELSYLSPSDQIKTANVHELNESIDKLKQKNKKFLIVIIGLAVVILGMFIIAATNENVGYINTENKILNKYSGWEEELTQRENAVKIKEQELNIEYDDKDTKDDSK